MRLVRSLLGNARRQAAPVAVAAMAAACAVAAWLYVRGQVRSQEAIRFAEVVSASTAALRDRIDTHTAVLRSTRGGIAALGRPPTGPEFRTLAESLDLARHYPGLQGLGWAAALSRDEILGFERAMQASGSADYEVWPAGDRPLYGPVQYLEPPDWRNQRAVGFDMYSEPTRRVAMESARTTGNVTATGRVVLMQEAAVERQWGFLVYAAVPSSRPGAPGSIMGWVYTAVRARDLLARTLGPAPDGVGLAVFDGENPSPESLLVEHGPPAVEGSRIATDRVTVGGRTWTLRYHATAAFTSRSERALPPAVFVAGLAIAVLLSSITAGQVRARSRAETAARRTAFLADVGKALAASLEYRHTLGRVAELAVGRIADACAICVLEPDAPYWMVAGHDPAQERAWKVLLQDTRLEPAGDGSRATIVRGDLPLVPRPAGLEAALAALGARAVVVVPLAARGLPLGGILLASGRRRRVGRAEAPLAEELGRLVSAAIDTARLFGQAQAAIQSRDEFLSIASHELKTPLTSLGLQADSLLAASRRTGQDPLVRKVEVIRRSVDRLGRLVASLLDLSRITAGRLELELEEMDLADVARDALEKFEEEAARAGCALLLDAPVPVVGRWDRTRLEQVFANLVSNAIKYGPGRPVEVRVHAVGPTAIVAVRDQGIGIAPEDQPRIFDRFERAVSRRNYGGFGLGLWIVRQIVEALGGTVRVESAPGAGATFVVELARTAAAGHEPPGSSWPEAPTGRG